MKFLLSIDTEMDYWKKTPNPFLQPSRMYRIKWQLNKIRGWFIYPHGDKGLRNIVQYLKENNIKADFNITGTLYRDNREFIMNEMNTPLFNLGLHGWKHECFPMMTQKETDLGIADAMLAAIHCEIIPIHYSAPFNVTENDGNTILYEALVKRDIRIVRYAGPDRFPHYNHEFKCVPPYEREGLIFVHASYTFDGTSSKKRIKEIIEDIQVKASSRDNDCIYCLSCHDFTFKNINKLKKIMDVVISLEKLGKIEIINSRDLLNET